MLADFLLCLYLSITIPKNTFAYYQSIGVEDSTSYLKARQTYCFASNIFITKLR